METTQQTFQTEPDLIQKRNYNSVIFIKIIDQDGIRKAMCAVCPKLFKECYNNKGTCCQLNLMEPKLTKLQLDSMSCLLDILGE